MAVSQVIKKTSGIELLKMSSKMLVKIYPVKLGILLVIFLKKMSDISSLEGKRPHLGD